MYLEKKKNFKVPISFTNQGFEPTVRFNKIPVSIGYPVMIRIDSPGYVRRNN